MRTSFRALLAISSVSLLVVAPAFAQGQPRIPKACAEGSVSKRDLERAQKLFAQGKEFLDEGRFDRAITDYTDAYELACNLHRFLRAMADAYERKGDHAAAAIVLETYLTRSGLAKTDDEYGKVQRRIDNLRKVSGATTSPSSSVSATVVVPPPTLTTTATAPTSTGTSSTPPVAPAGRSGPGPWPWVIMGVGGASAITGAILAILGQKGVSDVEKVCPSGVCNLGSPEENQKKIDEGNNSARLRDIGIISASVGGALLVGGLVWGLVDRPDPKKEARWKVTPVTAPGYAGFVWGGRF